MSIQTAAVVLLRLTLPCYAAPTVWTSTLGQFSNPLLRAQHFSSFISVNESVQYAISRKEVEYRKHAIKFACYIHISSTN